VGCERMRCVRVIKRGGKGRTRLVAKPKNSREKWLPLKPSNVILMGCLCVTR
jgi:hypothetical protein